MDENVGKIYCLDRGNDDALAAAILANGNRRDYDPMTAAALMNQNQRLLNAYRGNGCGCGCNDGCGNGCGC